MNEVDAMHDVIRRLEEVGETVQKLLRTVHEARRSQEIVLEERRKQAQEVHGPSTVTKGLTGG